MHANSGKMSGSILFNLEMNLDELREHDSYLRMADSYYMMSDFENARKNYIKSY